MKRFLAGLGALVVAVGTFMPNPSSAAVPPSKHVFVPFVAAPAVPTATPTPPPTPTPNPSCVATGESYNAIPIASAPSDRPADQHADLNLALRGWRSTGANPNLVGYNGGTDTNAPRLFGLFGDQRTPGFTASYQVYDWNWATNSRGSALTNWPVTLLGMATGVGEIIHSPTRPSGTDIYQGTYYALVLYATPQRITLKYTRDDNVVYGYTVHVENVCTDPNLLALYNQMNAQGRRSLPALRNGQAFGRANTGEIDVAIRDTGTFMDPRSKKDWWPGR